MLLPPRARKERTLLSGVITDRYDQIYRRLTNKLVKRLGAMSRPLADIDANLAHHLDRQWMDTTWMRSRAEDGVAVAAASAQQPLGHLRPRGVVGTQKEHTYWLLLASLLLVIRHSGSPVYTPLLLLRGGPHCTTVTCAFTQPRLGCDLQGIPGTPEWWCVAEVKVIELVDSDASVQSCRDHIDALGD